MHPIHLLIGLLLLACIPQPTTQPSPPHKPKAVEFIDSPEQVPS